MDIEQKLKFQIHNHLKMIYQETELFILGKIDVYEITDSLLKMMRLDESIISTKQERAGRRQHDQAFINNWSEKDSILITYGDSIIDNEELPLRILKKFFDEYIEEKINGIHILPFFPYSSDDGFSVIAFKEVNKELGDWEDIRAISKTYRLMSDLVLNHCSSEHIWFKNFKESKSPGDKYFYTVSQDSDISNTVRPRTSPLLQTVETKNGKEHVWCTFSHDQVDFNFKNPEVLLEFIKIIRFYLDQGIQIFRLDAVAFLWKEPGTKCINLYQTHEIIRLIRCLVEHVNPDAIIITETNIPNQENLEYFGNANEAHCIYNFSLPPLLIHCLIFGNSYYLKQWMMSMPPAQNGTTYFNFIASHDGIGLRPAEGLISDRELDNLSAIMENFGGRVSYRQLPDGTNKPYEINISLFDGLQGTDKGPDKFGLQRFICAHTIMLGLEGIPGIYIHSLLGTRNDYERLKKTGQNRAINRHQWDYHELTDQLKNSNSSHYQVYHQLTNLLKIRSNQPAFHPNATQFTLHLGNNIFGFWRQSQDRQQSIFCISNISKTPFSLSLANVNLTVMDEWYELITDKPLEKDKEILELEPYQTIWLTNYQ